MASDNGSADLMDRKQNRSVLMLHGLGVYGESWRHQIQALSQNGYFALAPDLPGFGSTKSDLKPWSVQGAVLSALHELDRFGIKKTVVCGLSMGGAVALQMAIDYPDRVLGLILINTFSALRPANLSETLYFVRRGVRAYLRSPADQAELVANRVFPHPEHAAWRIRLVESIRASDPLIYRQAMIALARFNVNKQLSKINIPTLVITGSNDSTIPPQVQGRLAKRIANSKQYLIDGAGHGVIVDHYAEVNSLMLEFLKQIYPS
ncbi:MAG: alpha/beta fold hydrolase [Bellilinea sp.]